MFEQHFSYKNLLDTYKIAKKGKLSTGRDRMNKTTFSKKHQVILEKASEKILNGTYTPTPYKLVLILKNRDTNPRCISIPTIRDNIIIDVIKVNINTNFSRIFPIHKVPDVVTFVSDTIKSDRFDSYIKLDISKYYDSINHDMLLQKLDLIIKEKQMVDLIDLFLKNPTLSEVDSKNCRTQKNRTGVPQGIAISNVLGNIYLDKFDNLFFNDSQISYCRYVDDILIFCNSQDISTYKQKIAEELDKLSLTINADKTKYDAIDKISFLGYQFLSNGTVCIAEKNIKRIEQSLEKIFSDYVSSHDKRIKGNIDLLKWKLNFKITGCFRNGRRYGWVIFFCQNEDETILHELDWLIKKLCFRFKVDDKLVIKNQFIGKRFVKTQNEFVSKKDNTDYIPNIDNFSQDAKRNILKTVCKRKNGWVDSLNDYLLDREFDRFIFKSIKDIENDLYQIYT